MNHNGSHGIELETAPRTEDVRKVVDGVQRTLHEFLDARAPVRRFSVFVRGEDGVVVGGLNARLAFGDLHVDQLWCDEHIRGNGYGSALLERAEAFARQHGARSAQLNTVDPNRVAFYEACGYRVLADVQGMVAGHAVHFLRKEL